MSDDLFIGKKENVKTGEEKNVVKVMCVPKYVIKKHLNILAKDSAEMASKVLEEDKAKDKIFDACSDVKAGKLESITLDREQFDMLMTVNICSTINNMADDMFQFVSRIEGIESEIVLPENTKSSLNDILDIFGFSEEEVSITKTKNNDKENN